MPLLYYFINLLAIIINKNDPTKDRIIGASIPRDGIVKIPDEYNNPPNTPPIIPKTKLSIKDSLIFKYLFAIKAEATPHIKDINKL